MLPYSFWVGDRLVESSSLVEIRRLSLSLLGDDAYYMNSYMNEYYFSYYSIKNEWDCCLLENHPDYEDLSLEECFE